MPENTPPSVYDRYHGKLVVLQLAERYGAVTAPGRPYIVEQEQRDPQTNEVHRVSGRPATQDMSGILQVHPDGSGGISLVLCGTPDPDGSKSTTMDIVLPDPKIVAYCTCVSPGNDTEDQ